MAPIAFFDERIPVEILRLMVEKLDILGQTVLEMNATVNEKSIKKACISDFISQNSKFFFEACNLRTDFFHVDPNLWPQNESFVAAKNFVKKLIVVNDVSERGVAMANQLISSTTSEADFQNMLQCMEKTRKESS